MNAKKDMDPMQMCRICAIDVDDDSAAHFLIKNNQITELGEKFISCLGIQLMKEGYPERVCDYCHLQLNTFHAFVRKAKTTSTQFESMLRKLKNHNELDGDVQTIPVDGVSNIEMISSADMEFEMVQNDDLSAGDIKESIEMEFVVDKSKIRLTNVEEVVDIPVNDIDDEYTIEYLDPEYIDDDGTQNEFDVDVDGDGDEEVEEGDEEEDQEQSDNQSKRTRKQANNKPREQRVKRTYPYKCTKCNKRFVYKEVYEAHIRIDKGLPGFSCPYCPKTFNEKANFDYHMQDHTNYRPAQCHLCEKSFKNKQDLASHIRCHKDIRKYMCDVCGKRFRSQSHMTYHRYAHFEARNFACDQCSQKFKSPHILRTHRNTVHSTVFRYECEQCGRKFKRDHHLVAHRRTHNKVPGSRKQRKKPITEKNQKTNKQQEQTFEVIEMIKDEELDYEDEAFETADFIAD